MREQVLFEITKDHLETGMRGFPVGYCTTSYVDEEKGLFYVGRPLSEMIHFTPIQMIYLLYHKKEGSKEEVQAFEKMLASKARCSDEVVSHIQKLPKSAHPMALFCTAIQILGMFEKTKDYQEDCLNIIAKLPHLAATVINYHAGLEPVKDVTAEIGYMKNFAYMVNFPCEDKELLWKVFRLFNILHYDHGGGNLSTFVGKAVASGMQHMYGSLSAAMNGLSGSRHGRANQDCLEFVKQIQTECKDSLSEEKLEAWIRDKIQHQELIYGFGHAVLRVEDPRATVLYEFAKEHFPKDPLVKTALCLRTVGSKVLKENPKIHNPYPNVDAISGTVLTAAGFPYPEYYTVLFGLARCVGIAIQIVYERCEAREGRGTPIIRPKYIYKAK